MTERKPKRRPDGTFQPGENARLKHGGAAAVQQLAHGEPLTGLAAEAEAAVTAELEAEGRYALVVRNARRLQAAADLYWNAVSAAAERQDLDALDSYVARFGWLSASALRAWAQARQEAPDGHADALEVAALEAARGAREAQEGGGGDE